MLSQIWQPFYHLKENDTTRPPCFTLFLLFFFCSYFTSSRPVLSLSQCDPPYHTRIISFSIPNHASPPLYSAGRTGRAGRKGLVTAIIAKRDKVLSDAIQVCGWAAIVLHTFRIYSRDATICRVLFWLFCKIFSCLFSLHLSLSCLTVPHLSYHPLTSFSSRPPSYPYSRAQYPEASPSTVWLQKRGTTRTVANWPRQVGTLPLPL
jgi:hypothetical protein